MTNPSNKAKARTILFGLSFFFLFGNAQPETEYDLKWDLIAGSSLHIEGKTNVNSFTCSLDTITEKETLIAIERKEKNLCVFFPNQIKISVMDMLCENNIMTKDLQKTLEAETYPFISINFINLRNLGTTDECEASFWLTIKEKRKLVKATCQKIYNPNQPTLEGSTNISFSEFGIEAPEKFFGAVSVKDTLTISFMLRFHSVSP